MKIAEIQQLLITVVREIQELGDREATDVGSDTRPIDGLPGFDSLNGVEATIEILHQMNVEADFNDVFVEDGKSLSIAEAAARLSTLASQQKIKES